jgi:hypothetical protein
MSAFVSASASDSACGGRLHRPVLLALTGCAVLVAALGGPAAAAYADGNATAAPVPSASDKGGWGQGPVTPTRCVVTHWQNIGAGTAALMTISPSGPSVLFQVAGEKGVIPGLSLDRKHPALPAGHFTAEILRPDSTRPQLLTNMEGGGHKPSISDFPRLPQGCSFDYTTTDGTSATGDPAGPHQTRAVPRGAVAAGYEAPDAGHGTLTAVGAAAGLGAAGIAFVVVRRRPTATR